MKTILAIETSVSSASIALEYNGSLTQLDFESQRQQNQLLFEPLKKLLADCSSIDTILVGTGPGSYSGARIAIAAAHGLATVHQAQTAGVCSFYATELEDPANAIAVGDARRGSYFIYPLIEAALVPSPELMSEEVFKERLDALTDKDLFTFETQNEIPYPNVSLRRPTASALISYWKKLTHQEQVELYQIPLEPLYLRAPFITKSTKPHPLLGK